MQNLKCLILLSFNQTNSWYPNKRSKYGRQFSALMKSRKFRRDQPYLFFKAEIAHIAVNSRCRTVIVFSIISGSHIESKYSNSAIGKKFGFIYLAHYGNWEWVSSMALHIHAADANVKSGQIYHPLRNAAFDRLFLKMRGRFDGDNIAMKETLRYILRKRQKNEPAIIGFIADQAPKWSSIHHWIDFLHHNTPVFTGTEQIAKQVDALLFYCHVERPSRGHYRCTITEITDNAKSHPDFELTDAYFARLAETINQEPALWLWSHKRWKRTYEEFLERQKMGLHG